MKKGITVAGTLISDVFYEIDTYPEQGLLTNVRSTKKNIGGSGNIILDLAKMDEELPVKVCAIVGKDGDGDNLLSILEKYPNIKTDAITVEGSSSVTIVMNANDTKQRTFFFAPGASDVFDESYIDWEKVDAKIFHLEYLLLMKKVDAFDPEYGTHGAKLLAKAKERGMMTSIDVVSEQSDRAEKVIKAALKYTDICCINEFETQSITGVDLMEDGKVSFEKTKKAMLKIKDLGVSKWIVVHSPSVGYGYDVEKNEFVQLKSYALPKGYVKGTTGAGDAYCGGILYAAYKDCSLLDGLKIARAAATCSLRENNGTDGILPIDEMLRFGEQFSEQE